MESNSAYFRERLNSLKNDRDNYSPEEYDRKLLKLKKELLLNATQSKEEKQSQELKYQQLINNSGGLNLPSELYNFEYFQLN